VEWCPQRREEWVVVLVRASTRKVTRKMEVERVAVVKAREVLPAQVARRIRRRLARRRVVVRSVVVIRRPPPRTLILIALPPLPRTLQIPRPIPIRVPRLVQIVKTRVIRLVATKENE
jgi:hypothetical protein